MTSRIAVAFAVFALCYAGVIWDIVGVWSSNALYSYGFVVPVISGYILYTKWDKLRTLRPSPDYVLGVATTVLGLLLLVVGRLGSIRAAEQGSLIFALPGLVLLLFGRQILTVVAFPLLYLMVAVPIWDRVFDGLQVKSQLLSGMIAARMLHAVGVPAFRDGTLLVLPHATLDILRACSGVNQLIAVVAMCLAAGYLWLSGYWRRISLLVFAVAVAYLSNGFRIAMVGFLGYNQLGGDDIQWLHLVEGLATSVLGYALIFGCLSILSVRLGRPGTSAQPTVPMSVPARSVSRRRWLDAGVAGMAVAVGVFLVAFRPGHITPNPVLRTFPPQVGAWTQAPVNFKYSGYRLAGADDELDRTYLRASGERVRLYIGYQRYEEQGKEVASITSWELTRAASPMVFSLDADTVRLNELVEVDGETRRTKFFWFDVTGRRTTSWYAAKGYTIWNALTRGRTDGAFVLVEWDAPIQTDPDASRLSVLDFVKVLRPHLAQYIPS